MTSNQPKHPLRIALFLGLSPAAFGGVVFSESFESPEVSGFDDNTVPANNAWIGSSDGFGATNRGLYNESVAWPATPPFTTPYGEQAYFLNYTNSALTTAVGATGQTLTSDTPYTVTFHAAVTEGTASSGYRVQLVAFGPGEDNSVRTDGNSALPGTVLAEATGTVNTNDFSEQGSLTFTADANDPSLGQDLAIRLVKASGSTLYDNIRLITGHDLAPSPADGEDLDAGGEVALSWTNMPPASPGGQTYVDVWFGSDPGSLSQVEDGALISTTTVSAPSAGTYYWRLDSYPEGDPNGTPEQSKVFSFTIADTDGDGLPDEYELANTDPPSNIDLDPASDLDNDGLTVAEEYNFGTDPNDGDTDGDSLTDGAELDGAGARPATSPVNADTDGDGLTDGEENNSGTWNSSTDTGTDPTDADTDNDGLSDSTETNTGVYLSRFDTGSNPHDQDSDDDGVWDWYEAVATFSDPNSDAETSPIPYPLPDPDPADTGVSDKPVKVYIMAGQSNTVGIGYVNGTAPGSLETITQVDNKFPNLIDESNAWTERNDVLYKGVVTATAEGPLTAGQGGGSNRLGPELGFGHVMGWYHDEPVLILKASQGNRSLAWDFCPPGTPSFEIGDTTYAGYGDSPTSWPTGTTPEPVNWYAGKQYDDCFLNEADWAPAGSSFDPINNAYDVLANFDTLYPQWAAQGYEIAGFCWWQGHKDSGNAVYAERYDENLPNLINNLRSDFNAPDAPFVVASIGFDGGNYDPGSNYDLIHTAQMAVGDPNQYPQYTGTVVSVDTTVYWRELDESPGNQDFHYNNNAETYMLVGDAMGRAMLTLQNDVTPPSPNPPSFDLEPTAVDPTTVGMLATVATDASGPVEYYFENVTSGTNSGWITEASWNPSGLTTGTPYQFRFKTRDAAGNESDWSATIAAAPGNDVTAPAPDPMSFALLPEALGEDAMAMTATSALDVNGVEYYFENTVGGAPDSDWVADPQYTATGLNPGTEYTWVVRARDSQGNTTADSSPASATTTAPDLTAPSVTTLSPAHQAENVTADTSLVITFDEDIEIGSGFIMLFDTTDGDGDLSIDVTNTSQVAILEGNQLQVTLPSNLQKATTYALQIDATAITDLADNNYAGIDDNDTWFFTTEEPPPAGLAFTDGFESPDVTAGDSDGNTSGAIDATKWVMATQGFGADRQGIVDEAHGDFTDPGGAQAFAFRYTNSGITTAEGLIGALTAGVTYSVSFDVVIDGHNGGTGYRAALVTFNGDNRNDCRGGGAGTGATALLASVSGDAPATSYERVTFEYTADGTEGTLGQDVALRFFGATNTAIIDNVEVSSGGGGGGNTFTDWIAGFNVGGLTGFDDDFDGDGIGNGLENYFGTDPGSFSDGLKIIPGDAGSVSLTHPVSDQPAEDISASYLWTTDLVTFHESGATVEGTTVTFTPGTPVDGMLEVATTMEGTPLDRIFVVIKATQN